MEKLRERKGDIIIQHSYTLRSLRSSPTTMLDGEMQIALLLLDFTPICNPFVAVPQVLIFRGLDCTKSLQVKEYQKSNCPRTKNVYPSILGLLYIYYGTMMGCWVLV